MPAEVDDAAQNLGGLRRVAEPHAQCLQLVERRLVHEQLAGARTALSAGEKLAKHEAAFGTSRQWVWKVMRSLRGQAEGTPV